MDQAPPDPSRNLPPATADEPPESEQGGLKEAVETAASAYFSACRKLARAVNRLKQR